MDAKEMKYLILDLKMQVAKSNENLEKLTKYSDYMSGKIQEVVSYSELLADHMNSIMEKIDNVIDISENPEWEVIKNKIEDGILNLKKFREHERLA